LSALSILFIGFLLGMKHATEADHLAAVATLATRQTSFAQTMVQGAAWGVGHTVTLMIFGGVVLALGKSIPENLAQSLELAVGVMLIVLGIDVLQRLARQKVHFHAHRPARKAPLRALTVGMMHGMAGSAALILLTLQSVPSVALGFLYIALFGAGSIIGMATLSIAIAVPLRLSARRLAWMHNAMTLAIGAFSLGLGAFVVYDIGFAGGLLLAAAG
jgi:hypothetical protein